MSEDEGDIPSMSEHSRLELGVISSNREEVPANFLKKNMYSK